MTININVCGGGRLLIGIPPLKYSTKLARPRPGKTGLAEGIGEMPPLALEIKGRAAGYQAALQILTGAG